MYSSREATGPAGTSSVTRLMEAVRRSAGSALLTDAQHHALDALRAEAERLAGSGRREEALRALRLATLMIASGPPALE